MQVTVQEHLRRARSELLRAPRGSARRGASWPARRSSMAPSRSRVICTRNGISARRFGSTGNVRSPSAASRVAGACSARRNRPTPTPSDARCASVRLASAGSTPLSSRWPKNGRGKSSLSAPTNAGTGTGAGSSGATRGSTESSRATSGTAIARRGKRNAHCSSTTHTELSNPSPSEPHRVGAELRETARSEARARAPRRSRRRHPTPASRHRTPRAGVAGL